MEKSNDFYSYSEHSVKESISSYTTKTFGWMFAGLLVTFLTALVLAATPLGYLIFMIPQAFFILTIAEIAVVLLLSSRINKLSVGTARALFFAYSILNGIVFSCIFSLFEVNILMLVFGATALFFGSMAVIGYYTQTDFSQIRYLLFAGVVFLALFWVFSLFLNLQQYELIICYIGVIIFLGFTAYDTQKIKNYYLTYSQDSNMLAKASIFSALNLYLDFVNLFLYILRILARRK